MIGNSAVRADLTSNRGLREAITGRSAASWTDWRIGQADPATKPESKPPDSLRQGASQAAGAAPTLCYGPAGDSAPRLRLR